MSQLYEDPLGNPLSRWNFKELVQEVVIELLVEWSPGCLQIIEVEDHPLFGRSVNRVNWPPNRNIDPIGMSVQVSTLSSVVRKLMCGMKLEGLGDVSEHLW
jgi:hypothetical protein